MHPRILQPSKNAVAVASSSTYFDGANGGEKDMASQYFQYGFPALKREYEDGEIISDDDDAYTPQCDAFAQTLARHFASGEEDVKWQQHQYPQVKREFNEHYATGEHNSSEDPLPAAFPFAPLEQWGEVSTTTADGKLIRIELPRESDDERYRAVASIENDAGGGVLDTLMCEVPPEEVEAWPPPQASIFVGMKQRVRDVDAIFIEWNEHAKKQNTIVARPKKASLEIRNTIKKCVFKKLGLDVPITIDADEKPWLSSAFAPTYCKDCNQNFSSRKMLFYHRINEHGDASVKCEECGGHFRTNASLTKHINEVHINPAHDVMCDICGRVFKGMRSLHTHMSRHRSEHGGFLRSRHG